MLGWRRALESGTYALRVTAGDEPGIDLNDVTATDLDASLLRGK